MVKYKLCEMAELLPQRRFEESWRRRIEKYTDHVHYGVRVAGWLVTGLENRLCYLVMSLSSVVNALYPFCLINIFHDTRS
ncbi:hypothetical protein C8R30_12017 [Nitrosomonas nitrosa]|jgi:hypothetical protein|uniref:Uncharacterized protein n=1 Tax=Nitrosomonas nitrosa TaxID=52442 RepID=A0A1I4SMI3_9PROT|nr:hypothetical protein C8R30_12017 [Nitrosomonas nitrosa]CAE6499811.1 hypothetical protein NMYAN_180033 [Nitrosomonas nitrosa]SFM65642.1 hypothetical protein SAMN05421880_12530 [Nitrosomonas nitrosa]